METVKEIRLEPDKNPFALTGRKEPASGGMMAVASSRQAAEVQAAMVIAKKFPRDQQEAYARIMTACQRKGLAESALYSYPRGGQQITGPSIRLAEAIAQNWGNLDFGIVELEQRDGESTVMAYTVDLETNTRQTKVFQVRHERHTKQGVTKLTDPRDQYELIANQGARRLRSCILGVIPGDIIDAAVEQCEKSLKGGKEPLIDRVRIMASKFHDEFGVTIPMIEKRLMHKLDSTNEQEMIALRKIYTSLKDGMAKREDFFEFVDTVVSADSSSPSSPQPSGQSGSVVGQAAPSGAGDAVIGEPAPAPKKEKKAPEPGSRAALVEELRDWFARDGITEKEFIGVCVSRSLLPNGTASISALGSDLLNTLKKDYKDLIQSI